MSLRIYTMFRTLLQRFGDAWETVEVATFNGLTGLTRQPIIRISVLLGVRPQRIAAFFLVLSLSLDFYGQFHVSEDPAPAWAWAFFVMIHVAVLGGAIASTTNMLKGVERTGKAMLTEGFLSAQKISSFWLLLTLISMASALSAYLVEGHLHLGLQTVENVLDVLTILCTWTLMTKPPSLWSRIKDHAKNWKPTFVPMPQGA